MFARRITESAAMLAWRRFGVRCFTAWALSIAVGQDHEGPVLVPPKERTRVPWPGIACDHIHGTRQHATQLRLRLSVEPDRRLHHGLVWY